MSIRELLRHANVRAPVRACPDEPGVIEDADGRDFATIDVNAERPEQEVVALTAAVAEAINLACLRTDARPRPTLIDISKAPSLMEQRYGAKAG